ncbi:MAG: acetyltransferase, ribosomal protein N-acetylase [Crocinitomicaceae bacterium]|jgi:RimJ/RimL family protein N-acetyltransferase|nr:acetyltransferase, ribosomal protein N-acetylase [Crocinitomicaceae bacterium]
MILLETNRLLLRPLEASDWEHLLPFALNEPETWQYSLISAAGEENLKNYIRIALEARDAGKELPFIVFDKQTQRYAGSTRFYDIQPENKSLQLGYTWYGKDFRGTGLNKHCKFLLLEYAFETLGMERVEFRADNDNKRSIAAMKNIGCTVEGVLRHNGLKPDGTWRDSIVLSILSDEWFASVKENLKLRMES